MKYESIRYSIGLASKGRKKLKELVGELEEAMRAGNGPEVKVNGLEINQHLETPNAGAIVRNRMRTMCSEGIKAAGLARVMKSRTSNVSTIRSLVDQQGDLVIDLEESCAAFHEQLG